MQNMSKIFQLPGCKLSSNPKRKVGNKGKILTEDDEEN